MRVPEEHIPANIAEYREALRKHPTPAEKRFRKYLQLVADMAQFEFEFQVVYHNPDAKKYYIVDFVIPFHKLVIEIDGPTHDKPEQKVNDSERDDAFLRAGYKVLRVKNNQTYNQVVTIKRICESLLNTRHALKVYSLLKKIKNLEEQWRKVEKKFIKDLDGAFDSAITRIFETKTGGQKSHPKPKQKRKGKRVICPGCGFKLYPNERQCPMCWTVRQVGNVSKCKPIKGALDIGETKSKLRKRN